MQQLDANDAARLVADGAMLLDVREQDEWDAGHAPMAVHLPMGEVAGRLADLPDGAIVVVCRSGARSNRVAAFLEQTGRTAHNLAGGMQAWARTGHDVVTEDGTAGRVA